MNKVSATVLAVMLCVLFLYASGVDAADQYSGGTIDWDNGTSPGWSSSSAPPYTQVWTNGNTAIFETNGLATLKEPITLDKLVFNGPNMTFTNSVLNFTGSALIDNNFYYAGASAPDVTTFSCGISGSPDVEIAKGDRRIDQGNIKTMRFAPSANSTQTLGQINFTIGGGSQHTMLELAGSSTNNTIESVAGPNFSYADYILMKSPGKWTINGNIDSSAYWIHIRVEGGTLVVNGKQAKPGLEYVENGRFAGNYTAGTSQGGNTTTFRSGGILSPGDGGIGTMNFMWNSTTSPRFNMQDNSVYEFDVGLETNDIVSVGGGDIGTVIDLDNFKLKIQDAGGEPVATNLLAVFTYESGVSVDMSGFGNTEANFDLSDPAVKRWGVKGLSLSNNLTDRTIYLVGLEKPAAGMILLIK